MSRASFRRKSSTVSLCKSIQSAIQWFLLHHGITFVTIHNPAVYLSGARVSISPTMVPRLYVYIYMFLRRDVPSIHEQAFVQNSQKHGEKTMSNLR